MMASFEDTKLCEGISNCFKNLVHAGGNLSSPILQSFIAERPHHLAGSSKGLDVGIPQASLSTSESPTAKFILRPGFTIDPDDYDPTNPDAPRNLAVLVDDIPKVSDTWQSTGSLVSSCWDILLRTGKAPIGTPDPSLKDQVKKAKKILYSDYDKMKKSPFYASLDSAAEEVTQKRLKLYRLQKKIHEMLGPDASQEEYDKLYAKLSPPYLNAIKIAQSEYESRYSMVQYYLSVIYTYTAGGVPGVMFDMRTKMERCKKGANDGQEYYEVAVNPTDWWTWFKPGYNSDEEWTHLTVDQNVSTEMANDHPMEMVKSVPFLQFTTSDGQKITASAEDSKDIVISFKGKTVQVVRQWLDTSLLFYDNITIAGAKAGQWSTGVMDTTNNGSFPLLLTAFMVAKDVTIHSNNFSSKLQDDLAKFSSSAIQKWNLLYFGGDDSRQSTWDKDKQRLSIPGVQIIGGICCLIPHFPTKSHYEK